VPRGARSAPAIPGGGDRPDGVRLGHEQHRFLPDPAPTPADRKRLVGRAVALAILVALLLAVSYGFWGSGQLPANP
jgi:hypothetical protein